MVVTLEEAEVPGQLRDAAMQSSDKGADTRRLAGRFKNKKKSVLVTGCLSVMLLPNGSVGSAQWCPMVGPSQALTWHDANRFCSKILHFGQEPAYSRSWAGGHLGRKRTRLYMD